MGEVEGRRCKKEAYIFMIAASAAALANQISSYSQATQNAHRALTYLSHDRDDATNKPLLCTRNSISATSTLT